MVIFDKWGKIMFWKRDEKIMVSGGQVIDCDSCPCPVYGIFCRCDYTWDGPPACGCDPVAAYRNQVSIRRVIQVGGTLMTYDTDNEADKLCVPIETLIADDAYGHIYYALAKQTNTEGQEIPKLFRSREAAFSYIESFGAADDPTVYQKYWGEMVLDKCPCACEYAVALFCRSCAEGQPDSYEQGCEGPFYQWPLYVVRILTYNNQVYLQNPHYGSSNIRLRYWVMDCTAYPARELMESPITRDCVLSSITPTQVSIRFSTREDAENWLGNHRGPAMRLLVMKLCGGSCGNRRIPCIPAGYRCTSLEYNMSESRHAVYKDGTSFIATSTYNGHKTATAEREVNHDDCNCEPGVSVRATADIHDHTFEDLGYTTNESNYDYTAEGEGTASALACSDGIGEYDCNIWLPDFSPGGIPGVIYDSWPNSRDPFDSRHTYSDGTNYLRYWTYPTRPDPDQDRYPHGTFTCHYNETEVFDMSQSSDMSTMTWSVTVELSYTIEPYFTEEYPDITALEYEGCKGGNADATGSNIGNRLSLPADYRECYNQLSEDLKSGPAKEK